MKVYIRNCFTCNRPFSHEVVPAGKIFDETDDWLFETAICADCFPEYEGICKPIVTKTIVMNKEGSK